MEIVIFLVLFFGPIIPGSFMIGKSMRSTWGGLLVLSILPTVIAVIGFVLYFDASNSSNSEIREWAWLPLFLVIGAGIMEVLGLIGWAIGRSVRGKGKQEVRPS